MDISEYTFPVKEIFKAMNVIKPSLDISDLDHLYIDFDSFRSESSFLNLMFHLGIIDNKVSKDTRNSKILYTGHIGSGKSTELLKLHHRLNQPEQYFSIYLNVEDYIQISDFNSDDLIVLFIAALVNALDEQKINFNVPGLQKISEDWLSDTEVVEEIRRKSESEGGASAEIGTGGLLKLFSAKAFIKSAFTYSSQTLKNVRKKIFDKQSDYIKSFNYALKDIRDDIRRSGKGREIVFILDGLEKLRLGRLETYIQTFFQNAKLLNDLNSSLICCVPIDTMYDSKSNRVLITYDQLFILPLIPINQQTIPLFSEIITSRIDKDTFFDEGVLEYCVTQSGGNPRQLLKIVDIALGNSLTNNFKISLTLAEKACKKLGLDFLRRLTTPHFEILEKGQFNTADPIILDLLFSLSLMEYNGEQNNRQINPLLKPFIKNAGSQ